MPLKPLLSVRILRLLNDTLEDSDMTRAKFAADMGATESAVSRTLSGKSVIKLTEFIRMTKVLKIPAHLIMPLFEDR